MDDARIQTVAMALEERRRNILRAGGREARFWRIMVGPINEKGKRIRSLAELAEWPWLGTALMRHGADSYLVGLHPNGFFLAVGVVVEKCLPGPYRGRGGGWAYIRFEREDDPLPIVKVVARLDALAQLRIAREDSWPFAICPRCGEVAWQVQHHVLACCGTFQFEGRIFGEGRWKEIDERTDNNEI